MIRLLSPVPTVWNRDKMRGEAFLQWPNLVDINEVQTDRQNVAVYFDSNPPTQTQFDAFVAAHDPTPPPPTAEQTLFASSIQLLRSTYNTARTAAQVNNCIDALTVVLRRMYRELQ